MFGTIRRHQTWLWVIIAGLTITSFIIYFGPSNVKIGNILGGGGQANYGMINGHPIERAQLAEAEKEAMLQYFVNNGKWPDDTDQNFKYSIYQRLMLIEKQRQLGIQVSTEAVADYVRQNFGQVSLDELEEKVLKPRGMNLGDFEMMLRHNLGIHQMMSLAGVSGKLVTPQEAEDLYRNEHLEYSVTAAFFNASNYTASVTVTPEILTNYFNRVQATYRLPDRVQVDYVKFDPTNYFAEVQSHITNMNGVVEQEFQHLGTNATKYGKTTEEVKAKIRESILMKDGVSLAKRAATDFANELDQQKQRSVDGLADLAKKKNLTVKTTEPFDRQDGPKDLNVSATFAKEAFNLTSADPFAGPVAGEDGYYVMALRKQFPSELPSLKDIEPKVTADYRSRVASQMAQQAGANFANGLTNGLPAGKSFAGLAADAKVKTESLPPFSMATKSLPEDIGERVNLNRLKQAALVTPVGKVSPFIPTEDGGLVLYVQSETPVDEAQMKKGLPEFMAYLRQERQNEAFEQWFQRQMGQDAGFYQTLKDVLEGPQQGRKAARKPAAS